MGDMTMAAAAGDEAGRRWTVVEGGRKVQKRGSRRSRRRKRQSY